MLLADALRRAAGSDVAELLADWFWLTTYGEMFAGLSGYRIERALRDLRDTVEDGRLRWSGPAEFRVRSLESADFRSARMKAFALTLARRQKLVAADAEDPFQVLANHGRAALFMMVPRGRIPKHLAVSPGTRFLCEPEKSGELRQGLLSGQLSSQACEAHVITDDALASLHDGQWGDFVWKRWAIVQWLESEFLKGVLERHRITK